MLLSQPKQIRVFWVKNFLFEINLLLYWNINDHNKNRAVRFIAKMTFK